MPHKDSLAFVLCFIIMWISVRKYAISSERQNNIGNKLINFSFNVSTIHLICPLFPNLATYSSQGISGKINIDINASTSIANNK